MSRFESVREWWIRWLVFGSSPLLLHQVHELLAAVDVGFLVDVPDVGTGRLGAHAQSRSDGGRRAAADQRCERLDLAGGEAVLGGGRGPTR